MTADKYILDDVDKAILNRIQSEFPVAPKPYKIIGDDLGLEEDQVIDRVRALKANDVIRRIGGNIVPRKIGFVSTLCAARVAPEKIDAFAAEVNRYDGVTHNYQRDHEYNVWFTFIAPSRKIIQDNLSRLEAATGEGPILNLPATRVFKIRAEFDV